MFTYKSSKLGEALRSALEIVEPSRTSLRRMVDTFLIAAASWRSSITRSAWSICKPPSNRSAISSVNRMICARFSFGASKSPAACALALARWLFPADASSITFIGVSDCASSFLKASAREPTVSLPVICWPDGFRAV